MKDRSMFGLFVIVAFGGVFLTVALFPLTHVPQRKAPGQKAVIIGGCDESLWAHTYHEQRLQVAERCASVTGITVDATKGKRKIGCRSEADGDLHCWLKLDAGQEQYINQKNFGLQGGNLVYEPECQHRVTQEDAKQACKNWKQELQLAPIGAHVRITGAAVLDTQHGHREIHPVSSIEVLK